MCHSDVLRLNGRCDVISVYTSICPNSVEMEVTGRNSHKSQRFDGARLAFRFLIAVVFWKKGISNICIEAGRGRGELSLFFFLGVRLNRRCWRA